MMTLPFTEEESESANDTWGANCGPHSVAAALMLTLDQVRPLFAPTFEQKFRERGYGFTNPTMMGNALAFARVPFTLTKNLRTQDLRSREGICRIQWEGPWLKPGAGKGGAMKSLGPDGRIHGAASTPRDPARALPEKPYAPPGDETTIWRDGTVTRRTAAGRIVAMPSATPLPDA